MDRKFTLTSNRKFQLKRHAEFAGCKVGFSDDNRFAWIIINDHGDARFMNAVENYGTWRLYETSFIRMVEEVRKEQRKHN